MLASLQRAFKDPVILADGHTFEREAAEEWLATRDHSFMTGERLCHRKAHSNLIIKMIYQDILTTSDT